MRRRALFLGIIALAIVTMAGRVGHVLTVADAAPNESMVARDRLQLRFVRYALSHDEAPRERTG